jgi:hypothetical protein
LRASQTRVGVKVQESSVWDRELKGLGVQVMPTGLKNFVVQYRTLTGRYKRTVIGRYGLMTVEEARTLALEKLVVVSRVLSKPVAYSERSQPGIPMIPAA